MGTPRVRMPMSTRSRLPLCDSTISCAIRTMARRTSSELSRTTSRLPDGESGRSGEVVAIKKKSFQGRTSPRRLRGHSARKYSRRLPFRPHGTGLKVVGRVDYSTGVRLHWSQGDVEILDYGPKKYQPRGETRYANDSPSGDQAAVVMR